MVYVCAAKGGINYGYTRRFILWKLIFSQKCAKLDDEMKELLSLFNRNEGKLPVTLSDKQKETFEKYKDCNREISEICERQSFIKDFKLGAKIVIESMT